MQEKNTILPFVIKGILVGLLFPISSIALCYFVLSEPYESFSISQIHRDYPLLYVIDSAPVVLGLISFIVGSRVNRSNSEFSNEITEMNARLLVKNDQLNDLVVEKEVLLKEIHHRVKNNLQIITSLLSLQSSFIEDDKTRALFRYSQYRINSMAMIHEMLYKTSDVSKINYEEYVNQLIKNLISSMRGTDHKIKSTIDVPSIELNIDTAIPLGLLINEIITNSLKYGFTETGEGELFLEIKKIQHDHYRMIVSDNGKGFSEGVNFRSSNSLGLMLIHRLTIQLKGNIEKDNSFKGTRYVLDFHEITQNS